METCREESEEVPPPKEQPQLTHPTRCVIMFDVRGCFAMVKEMFTKELLEEFKKREMTLTQISNEIYGHTENYRNVRRAYKRHGIEPFRVGNLKPSKADLEDLILERGLTPYQVAELLGYGPLGWSNIYACCREYGIEFDFTVNAEAKKVEIKGDIASIMYGSFLGDGYINPGGYLVLSHGEKQLDYLEWKVQKLNEIMNPKINKVASKSQPPFSQLPVYSARSKALPFLKEMRGKLYPSDGSRPVTPIIESPHFDELALAIWFFDDGSKNNKTCQFATNRYSIEDVDLLCDVLDAKFGIKSVRDMMRSTSSGKEQYIIRTNTQGGMRLFSIINKVMPYIPPSVRHKVPGQ